VKLTAGVERKRERYGEEMIPGFSGEREQQKNGARGKGSWSSNQVNWKFDLVLSEMGRG
jgi:hypothetical protein